ncbi:MAG: hypothetical protein WA950_12405 [Shinella sp.]
MPLQRRPGLDLPQAIAHFIIAGSSSLSGVMHKSVANRVKRNHGIDIVGSLVRQSVDMVAFQVRSAISSVEWSSLTAAFAKPSSSVEDVRGDHCSALIDVSGSFTNGGISVACCNCALAQGAGIFSLKSGDVPFEVFLTEVATIDQVENDLLHASDIDDLVAIVEPLAIEAIFVILFQKQKQGPAVFGVIADLVVVVPPGISRLGTLAVIFIASVSKEAVVIVVFVPMWVGNNDYRFFDRALTNAHHLVAAEYLTDVCSAMKYATNVFKPGHHVPPHSPVMVVMRHSFERLNGVEN